MNNLVEEKIIKILNKIRPYLNSEGGDLQYIGFEDGIVYTIDRLKHRTRAHATKVGGTGIRYTVVINGTETYLYEDEDRWFVEAKGNVRC